jgi:DNA modification methylase
MSVQDVLDGNKLWAVECGDSVAVLSGWPAECVQTAITSPPYYQLRRYLKDGDAGRDKELGGEASVEEYIARLTAVFREVKRVLVPHGVCFVNLAPTYAGGDHASKGNVSVVNVKDNEAFMLREDLTADEIAYVLAELAAIFRDG